MVDKNRLMEELRSLKKQIKNDPAVLALYDLDGSGDISGDEWEIARQAVISRLEAGESQPPPDPDTQSTDPSGSAADQVFDSMKAAAPGGEIPKGSLYTEQRIIVQQQVETLEMVTNLEGRNSYTFLSASGSELARGEEQGAGVTGALKRNLWELTNKNMAAVHRPFDMDITVSSPADVIHIHREISATLSMFQIFQNGKPIGEIHKKFTLIKRKYNLVPYFSIRKLVVSGSPLSPWSFKVTAGGADAGEINKQLPGLRDIITNADTFQIALTDTSLSVLERKFIIAAAIVIDLDYFEEK